MRRWLCILIAAMALIPEVRATGDAPETAAHAAILIHMDSGRVLYEKRADERMPLASTTKIMTALVALERCEMSETVTVSPSSCGAEGSSVYLRPGEECSVEMLLYGLLLASGNDAALALAEHVSGSVEAFVSLMNDRAAQLGLQNTRFSNPHGLDAPDHYTSASELARIACAAMENERFAQIVSTRERVFGDRVFVNHNKLLWRIDGCKGIKTGYTKAAGRCLVSCAERDGLRLLCVTLSDPQDWADHAALLEWGFSAWEYRRLFPSGVVCNIPVIAGEKDKVPVSLSEDAAALVRRGTETEIRFLLPGFVYADVTAGDHAGELRVYAGGEELLRGELVYSENVSRSKAARLSLSERIRRGLERSARYGGIYPYCVYGK